MRKKLASLLIVSLVLSSLQACTNQNREMMINTGYDVLDYLSTDSEIFEVLEKTTIPKKPKYLGTTSIIDLKRVTVSITAYEEVTKEEVDKEIEMMRNNQKEKRTPNRKDIKDGDIVNIDYVGTVNGEEFTGGRGQGYDLTIGSNTFVSGFESQLIGKEIGKKYDIYVTFPNDYYSTDLKGKRAKFSVTINYLAESIIPEYDDAFRYKNSKSKSSSSIAFEKEIKNNIKNQREYMNNYSAQYQIEQAILEGSTFEPTKEALAWQFVQLVYKDRVNAYQYEKEFSQMIKDYGMNAIEYVNSMKEYAASQIKNTMMLDELKKQFGITISKDDERIWFEQMSNAYDYGDSITLDTLKKQAGEDYVESEVLKSKVYAEAMKEVVINYTKEA
ncbi:MAG: trigger factor [Eubacteriales bacterium]|nr:trigger factor [Eubacteriales bacterium]